jgi:hypoxanthine-DNA glycosylase
MKGKNAFSKREVELIESLILQRCDADRSQQKVIRSKMRSLGFYGSDYGIVDMTIDKFRGLIGSGQIKVSDVKQVISAPTSKVEKSKSHKTDSPMKSGLDAWSGDNPIVLILGTFPGEKSLSAQAYYQNRAHNSFYKIMETLFNRPIGLSDKEFITQNHIALWDCMKEADRKGSLDSNIKSYVPNEIEDILALHPTITTIVLNGTRDTTKIFEKNFDVARLEQKYRVISLPSTSNSLPKAFDEKLKAWQVVKEIIDEQIKV